ncbi:MAG: histidine kinase [Anaerolineae bacterium]
MSRAKKSGVITCGRGVHDGLGPSLASLMLQSGAARSLLQSDLERVDGILLEPKTQIQTAITDVRRISYELRPPILDELGLSGH